MKQMFLVGGLAMGLALALLGCDRSTTAPPSPTSAAADATNVLAAAPKPRPEFQKLIGQWERPDGGYVLEIRSVGPDGKLDATYSNPSPIHVSRAAAYREGDKTKVVVELTDVNYPGCVYQLDLDEAHDQLYGTYFQAAMRETFDVTFARLK